MTVVANPFPPVAVLPVDRDALFGGLISAGHHAETARHTADTLPETDGALQMLARYRLLSKAEADMLLRSLAASEATYRRAHDLHGDDSLNAGRAWDAMRRSGDRARAYIEKCD